MIFNAFIMKFLLRIWNFIVLYLFQNVLQKCTTNCFSIIAFNTNEVQNKAKESNWKFEHRENLWLVLKSDIGGLFNYLLLVTMLHLLLSNHFFKMYSQRFNHETIRTYSYLTSSQNSCLFSHLVRKNTNVCCLLLFG